MSVSKHPGPHLHPPNKHMPPHTIMHRRVKIDIHTIMHNNARKDTPTHTIMHRRGKIAFQTHPHA